MLAFSNDYYGMIFRATQSVELFCAYYDSDVAKLIEQERNELCQKRYDNHGTNVNCYNMNLSVEQLNVDLM